MEREQMEAFLALAKTNNFTRAAEMLHVAQSTITTRIKLLEQATGQTLFSRDHRQVELTASGLVLLPYVQRALSLIEEGLQVTRMQNYFAEHLVIGSLSSLWHYYLFPIVSEFRKQAPNTSLRFITGHSGDIVSQMVDGLVDVGLVFLPPQQSELEVIPLFTDSIHLVGAPCFALPDDASPLTPAQLYEYPYLHINWGSPFTEWYNREIGNTQRHALQLDDTGFLLRYLLAGEGIGFLLDFVTKSFIESGQLRSIPFQADTPIPLRTTYLIYPKRKRQAKALQAFIEFLQKNTNRNELSTFC